MDLNTNLEKMFADSPTVPGKKLDLKFKHSIDRHQCGRDLNWLYQFDSFNSHNKLITKKLEAFEAPTNYMKLKLTTVLVDSSLHCLIIVWLIRMKWTQWLVQSSFWASEKCSRSFWASKKWLRSKCLLLSTLIEWLTYKRLMLKTVGPSKHWSRSGPSKHWSSSEWLLLRYNTSTVIWNLKRGMNFSIGVFALKKFHNKFYTLIIKRYLIQIKILEKIRVI